MQNMKRIMMKKKNLSVNPSPIRREADGQHLSWVLVHHALIRRPQAHRDVRRFYLSPRSVGQPNWSCNWQGTTRARRLRKIRLLREDRRGERVFLSCTRFDHPVAPISFALSATVIANALAQKQHSVWSPVVRTISPIRVNVNVNGKKISFSVLEKNKL